MLEVGGREERTGDVEVWTKRLWQRRREGRMFAVLERTWSDGERRGEETRNERTRGRKRRGGDNVREEGRERREACEGLTREDGESITQGIYMEFDITVMYSPKCVGICVFTSSMGEDGEAECGRDSGYLHSRSGLKGSAMPTRFTSGVRFSGGTFILYRKRRL